MSAFAGIDYDTHGVHIVYLFDDRVLWRTIALEGHDAFDRTRKVWEGMPVREHWAKAEIIAIGIEEPQGAQRATVAKLKAIQGAILSCLPSDLLVNPMVPAAWRKTVGLPGNASKGDIALFGASRGFMPASPTQDAYDAYCLALAVKTLTQVAA